MVVVGAVVELSGGSATVVVGGWSGLPPQPASASAAAASSELGIVAILINLHFAEIGPPIAIRRLTYVPAGERRSL